MGWILGFGIPLTYFFGVAVTFRILYVRTMKAYLRWKNEAPRKFTQVTRSGSGYYDRRTSQPRSEFTYEQYLDYWDRDGLRPAHAWLWPGLLTVFPVAVAAVRFCTPNVKVPDQIKIKKMELEDL